MITLGDIKKVNELSSKILEITEDKDELTQSDLQGAIEAVLLNAIQYGKGQSWTFISPEQKESLFCT